MAAKGKSKAVTKKNNSNAMMSEEMPDYLKDKTGERGSEEVTADDMIIPRIELVQALSPCRKKSDPAYIAGAEEGMLYNSVTRELYGSLVSIIPVFFQKQYLVWHEKQGGGFRGAFNSKQEAEDQVFALADNDESGFHATETAQHYVLVLKSDGTVDEAVISMARTKLKVSRQLNSLVRLAGGDRFSRVYKLGAMEVSSDNGDYYNLAIHQLGYPAQAAYEHAEKLYEAISGGGVVIDQNFDVEAETVDDNEEM